MVQLLWHCMNNGFGYSCVLYSLFTLSILYYVLQTAWYDADLVQYQRERNETELEKTFHERKDYLAQQDAIEFAPLNKPKAKEAVPEWLKQVKNKKNDDYYGKLQNLENEQVVKECRLREANHQYAIPGEKIVNTSMAKGMAQKYQENMLVSSINNVYDMVKQFVFILQHGRGSR